MRLLRKLRRYTAKDSEKLYRKLIKHGISEKTAQKIIKFYEEEG
jgi:uncharacterized protein YpmB